MIERSHLQIIRQLKRDGSLTAAAKTLHLTQSALSHAIHKLENQVGTRIWRREGRHVLLSPAGDCLLDAANRILPQLERADEVLTECAEGARGTLRFGMECHPCYRWLLKVIAPYLQRWPGVDIDVTQQFQFGGMAALFNHEIDILVTPDPLVRAGVSFQAVFDYEQVLVVAHNHRLAGHPHINAADLDNETLYAYPVEPSRLDIYTQLLTPSGHRPKKIKTIESTDIMLQLVSANRGVAALPRWLADEYAQKLPLTCLKLGAQGIHKQIHLGIRTADRQLKHVQGFLQQAGSLRRRNKWSEASPL